MYWFAHGGLESSNDKCLNQRSTTPGECDEDNEGTSPTLRSLPDRRGLPDDQKSPLSLNSGNGTMLLKKKIRIAKGSIFKKCPYMQF